MRTILMILILIVATLPAPRPAYAAPPSRAELERDLAALFARRAYDDARRQLEAYLDVVPHDAGMQYNLACALARCGEPELAVKALVRAVQAGFDDYDHMLDDRDLDAVRDLPAYRAFLERVQRRRAKTHDPGTIMHRAIERWLTRYDQSSYVCSIDESMNIAYALGLDDETAQSIRSMVEREATHLATTLFDGGLDVPVLIVVPTPADARVLLGDRHIGGRYLHSTRELIARNTGDALRHEFVHAMHYAHMERLGQKHPLWLQEGLASLYESYSWADDGRIVFEANDRRNIAKRRQRAGRLMPWSDLFALNGMQFMRLSGRLYPEVRSIFEFIADDRQLETWYRTYVEHYDEDSTGRIAFERTFNASLETIERRWHDWLARSRMVDDDVRTGDASLGIRTAEQAVNDGVLVTGVLRAGGADRAGLRAGDVIVALNDIETQTLRDLTRLLGECHVGDRVRVRIRRGDAYRTLPVVLTPLHATTRSVTPG